VAPMPQGTMPSKWLRSGSTLIAMPWKATQRRSARRSRRSCPRPGRRRARRPVGADHPDADAARAALAGDAEFGQGAMIQSSRRRTIGAHVAAAAVEVEHRIGHPLARAVIGVFARRAAPRRPGSGRGRAGRRPRRGAGGVERRVFEQPDELVRRAAADRLDPRLHRLEGLGIRHQPLGYPPFRHRATALPASGISPWTGLVNPLALCYMPPHQFSAVVAELVDAQR
jgi:hypothetical protein